MWQLVVVICRMGPLNWHVRDTKTKETVRQQADLAAHIENLLEEIQQNIYKKAFNFRAENTKEVDTYDEFKRLLDEATWLFISSLGWYTVKRNK